MQPEGSPAMQRRVSSVSAQPNRVVLALPNLGSTLPQLQIGNLNLQDEDEPYLHQKTAPMSNTRKQNDLSVAIAELDRMPTYNPLDEQNAQNELDAELLSIMNEQNKEELPIPERLFNNPSDPDRQNSKASFKFTRSTLGEQVMKPDFDPVQFRKGVSMHTGSQDNYETMSRAELINLLRQAQFVPEKRVRSSQIDIGFLHASPLVYRD